MTDSKRVLSGSVGLGCALHFSHTAHLHVVLCRPNAQKAGLHIPALLILLALAWSRGWGVTGRVSRFELPVGSDPRSMLPQVSTGRRLHPKGLFSARAPWRGGHRPSSTLHPGRQVEGVGVGWSCGWHLGESECLSMAPVWVVASG